MRKTYFLSSALLLAFAGLKAQVTFNYTGGMQTYTVPACVYYIHVDISGAQGGGDASVNAAGGQGGRVEADLAVNPGDVLNIFVGGQGNLSGTPGYNGGGAGIGGSAGIPGGGGGGASDIRFGGTTLNDRIIVAGGGGGGVDNGGPATGGAGGGLTGGGPSPAANPWACSPLVEATGGTQNSGGLGGTSSSCAWNGSDGAFGIGGASYQNYRCGGGGGGWYGGGGGHNGCGGAGGSSYTTPSAMNVMHTQGYRAGDGVVIITGSVGPINGPTAICEGSTVTFSTPVITNAISYTWTVPAGSTIVSGQGTNTISVTAGNTSGNVTMFVTTPCGNSPTQSFAVTMDPAPVAGTTTTNITGICVGDPSLTLTVTGETGSVGWEMSTDGGVTWNPFGTGNPLMPGAPNLSDTGSYLIHAVISTGPACAPLFTNDVSVTVYPPANAGTASVTATTVCSGSTVTLSSAGASTGSLDWYEFDGVNYNYLGNGTPFTTAGLSSGTYNFVAILTAGSCAPDTSNMLTVTADAAPVAGTPVSTAVGGNVCVNDSISFIANGSFGSIEWLMLDTATSTWLTFGTGSPFSPGAPSSGDEGQYTFIAVASNGVCPSDTSAQLIINVRPLPVVTLGNDTVSCGPLLLDAGNPGSSYLWNTGATTQTISASVTGPYIPVVTSQYGCAGTDTINVTIMTPVVTAGASATTVCTTDAVVTLNGTPAGGTWSGAAITGSTFDPAVAGAGTFNLVYTWADSTGCPGYDTVQIVVSPCVGIAEQGGIGNVSVFPNPNNGTFTIASNADIDDLTIEVTDMQGRVVSTSEEHLVKAGFSRQVTLGNEAAGIYFVRLIANGEQSVLKINVVK